MTTSKYQRSFDETSLAVVVGVDAGVHLGLHLLHRRLAGAAGAAGSTSGHVLVGAAAQRTTNGPGFTLKPIVTLLAASEYTTLFLEPGHADGGKSRSGVDLSGVMVDFVDRDSGVDDGSLDGFALHNGLDGLVDVVVDVLAGNDGVHGVSVCGFTRNALILELLGFTCKTGLGLGL